ncbi:OprO/OprP family phosphate-selective porin [Croceicoccus naphthovorans]|uniref:Uncharacterized protein n=1 Tax=Croceicoccus naphthovorans TaxID=1348774 RepID=A0A0G3XEX4_9SPHN|nr:porin [Croceicoccus naphthovorans]AKM09752.1 hypothetical protein AB433_06775 [Croceicoccus naphthovorans]MBB3990705.1 phosphate-selective porin OprO/OprP [Croceicoccus naphthovorans]
MRTITTSAIAMIAAAGLATPAFAQDSEAEAMRAELEAMRAQMQAMAARIDSLEGQLVTAQAKADAATETSTTALAAAEEAKSDTSVKWKGAPQFEGNGFTFKPRGRMQYDVGYLGAPDSFTDSAAGFGSELRRAYLGFEGTIPGGFGYRAEVNLASEEVEFTDLYITYAASESVKLTLGHQKPFWGLEELSSDLFTSFTERAAINTAFGYERKVGLSAAISSGDVLAQGGIFTDSITDLNNDDGDNELAYSGRVVFMPKLGENQLHLGANVNYRDANAVRSVNYRVRPSIHTPDVRFIATGGMPVESELAYGLEAGYIAGPFHAAAETHWQKVGRPGLADPTFFGGYAEVGYFITGGDSRGYKNGAFDRVKPTNGVDKGGLGALQVNVRYDYLDLNDAGVVGGKQDGYELSLIWTPTDYTRFLINYGRMEYTDAAIPGVDGDRSYGVDAFGARAQIDF